MLNKLSKIFAAAVVVALLSFSVADANPTDNTSQKQMEKTAAEIFKRIGGTVKSIKPAPVMGIYEIMVEKDGKSGVVYLDQAGKHLIEGMVLDVDTLQPVFSHPEEMLQPKRQTFLDVNKIPVNSAVIMGNLKGTRKLYVFTDPDCPYCHKMHLELKKLEKIAPDLAIHIMLFPLPMHPGSYDKSRTVLEMMDLDMLDKAFEGKDVPKPLRDSSKAVVDAVIKFAVDNGINGTPTLVLGDGRIVVGMKDARALKQLLSEIR